MELYIGIDTSCYTTSLAIVDGEGNLLSEARKLLEVRPGGRGLAQNEAVFQHIANLPGLFSKLAKDINVKHLAGIAISTRPRPVEGSYMPVFRVAASYGQSLAAVLGIPFVETSHQEGHLAAGIWSAGGPDDKEFLAIHLSGGTTELLRINSSKAAYHIDLMGGTRDLHAGQLIDRVGVRLGLPFPAGPHLEKLAASSGGKVSVPSSVKGCLISFSGPEAAAMRLIERQYPPADIARAVENCIAKTLHKVITRAIEDTGIKPVLIVGGVSANMHIRERLSQEMQRSDPEAHRLYFAAPGFSSDNAVGTALIGMERLKG